MRSLMKIELTGAAGLGNGDGLANRIGKVTVVDRYGNNSEVKRKSNNTWNNMLYFGGRILFTARFEINTVLWA